MSSPTPADMSLPTAVVPGLYIGDKRLAANKDVLHALGITHIVNVTHDVRHYFEYEPHTFTYLRCPCHDTDTADLYPHFAPAAQFIHSALQAGHAALVHCQQGISRSAAVATAYLIRQHSLSLRDAYVKVKASRPTVKVNANFLKQLMRWETECRRADEEQKKKTEEHTVRPSAASEKAVEGNNKRRRPEEEEERSEGDEREKQRRETEQKDSTNSVQQPTDVDGTKGAQDTDSGSEERRSEEVSAGKRQKVAVESAQQLSQAPLVERQTEAGAAEADGES